MALTLEQFGKALAASGLMTPEDVRAFWNAIPAAERPKDADGFAQRLVAQKLLTEFQARQMVAGRGASLVMGDYAVLAEIGAGGMGQVYKAKHRRMERIVALKVMSSAAMKDEAAVKRFQREVRAAARLEHPNIVTAYDSGEAGNVKYLVMQFVDGGDLSDLVKKNGPLPIEKAVDYVLQAARGLAFAHAEGVIHRDIKPANLLLDKKGIVKILDMGLARIESSDDGLTATEQVMGTVDYMSPEQAANTKGADGRADIYSLGCTLWFLLTGKKAYDGDTMIARLMAHREAPLPSLVKTRDDAPWALEQALHKMLAKRPQDRFQSMEEVVTALEPFSGGGSSKAGMGSSIGMGKQADAELAAFFQNVGPKNIGPGTKTGLQKTEAEPKSATKAGVEATAAFQKPEADTDPKSQLRAGAPLVGRAAPVGGDEKKIAPTRKKQPPIKLIAGGVLGVALLVVAGIIVKVRDRDGNVVAELNAPDGVSAEVTPTVPDATTPAPIAPPDIAPSKLLESREFVWTLPENLGLPVNTERSQSQPTLTADELCLICMSQPEGKLSELVECVRPSIDAPFGPPKRLTGATGEKDPCLSADGLTLIYASTESSFGENDLWIRRRASRADDWGAPVHLLQEINGPDDERAPCLSLDGLALYFASNRPGGMGGTDIWVARRKSPIGSFEKAVNFDPRLNSPSLESEPTPLSDGNMLFLRNNDAYHLSFKAASGILSALPVEGIRGNDGWLSPDGRRWYFSGMSPTAGRDLWVMRRVPANSVPAPPPPSSSPSFMEVSGGTALQFNGENASVVVPKLFNDGSHPITIEAYFRGNPSRGYGEFGAGVLGWNGRFYVIETAQHLLKGLGATNALKLAAVDTPSTGPKTDRLRHVALVWDGEELRLYQDGVRVNAKPLAELRSVGNGETAETLFTIGASGSFDAKPPSLHVEGVLDEVRVSKCARYAGASFQPQARFETDADTMALYHCDEGSGKVLHDASGNGRDGEILGAEWVPAEGPPAAAVAGSSSSANFGGWTYGPSKPLFDGKSLAGWTGDTSLMSVENGVLVNDGKRGVVVASGEYRNFEVELDFRLAAGGNSGLGIFYPGNGDPSKEGLEVQMLDDPNFANVQPMQRCGSLYQLAAPTVGHYRSWPEWNNLVVRALGDEVEVVLNDTSVVKASRAELLSSHAGHVGLKRESGKIALFPHTARSEYGNIRVREATQGAQFAASPAAVIYLDDLPEKAWHGYQNLCKHGQGVGGAPLSRKDNRITHSLLTPTTKPGDLSFVEYELGGRFEKFEALTYLVREPTGGPQTFRVLADGKKLWESPPQTLPNVEAEVSLSMKGVNLLRLEVSGISSYSHPLWLEPRLTPSAAPAPVSAAGNHALQFDGTSAHVALPLVHDADSPLTIEVTLLPGPSKSAVVSNSEGRGIGIDFDKNAVSSLISREQNGAQGYVRATAPQPWDASRAHQLAAVYDGTKLRLFVDGKLQATTDLQGKYLPSPLPFMIGASPEGTGIDYAFTGALDEVRFSKTARYTQDYAPIARLDADADTLALYHCDEGSGNVLRDSSGNGRDGKIVGAKWLQVGGAASARGPRNALQLRGAGYVDLASDWNYDGSDLTFEAWLVSDTPRSMNTFLAVDHDAGGRRHAVRLSRRGDQRIIEVARPSDQLIRRFDDTLPSGRPTHFAAVWRGPEIRVYVDGKQLTPQPHQFPFAPRPGKPYAWMGGMPADASLTKAQQSCEAILLETRITSRARYDGDFTPPAQLTADADTVSYFKCDEGAGDLLHDSSGRGRNARIYGPQWLRVEGVPIAAPSKADLLKNLDVVANAVAGKFALDREGLRVTDETQQARIVLPVASMSEEYDLHVAVGRIAPGGKAFVVGVPWRGSQGCVVVDGFSNPPLSGLELIDGQTPKVNGTENPGEKITFGPRNHQVVVRVRNESIAAECDGKPLFEWKGKPSQLSTHAMWEVPRKDLPFLGFQGPYVVYGVELVPAGANPVDKASSPRAPPADASVNQVLRFGLGDVVEVSNIPWGRLDSCTLEALVRSDETAEPQSMIVDRFKAVTLARVQGRWQMSLKYEGDPTPTYLAQQTAGPLGVWQHAAAVVDKGTARLFVDGKPISSKALTKPLESQFGDKLTIGKNFIGEIRAVRVSKIARYTAEFAPPTNLPPDADTLASYGYTDGDRDVLKDTSGHKLDGKITGAKWVSGAGSTSAVASGVGGGLDLSAKLNPGAARVGLPQFLDREKPFTVEMVVTPRSLPETTAKNRKLWQFEFFDLKQYGDQWEWLPNVTGDDGKRIPGITARGAVQPGKRACLAGVWTGKELRFFVDGRLIGSTTPAKLPPPLTYNSHSFGGKHEDSPVYGPFDGILHEARISQTARYDRDYVSPDRFEADADTAALYRCDEGSGDVLRDASGHGRDGRIIGATWVVATPAAAKAAAASALFNGNDLAGWKGDSKVWTWESGELVGKLSGNGYAFLSGTKPYQDFELTYEVRLQGDQANSGVQFRSEPFPPAPYGMTGPQCEIGGTGKTGYGGLWWEKGPANGVKSAVPPEKFGPLVKPDGYNRMTLRCVGKRVTITLNGTTTVDGDFEIAPEGLLGWQLVSRGAPVEVRVRKIEFRDLSAGGPAPSSAGASSKLFFHDPGFEPWLKEVRALPVDRQLEAVRKKLTELNPGFDGVFLAADMSKNVVASDGTVRSIGINVHQVRDVSPVRALPNVAYLTFGCPGYRLGKLSDLSPLRGMALKNLNIHRTIVSDLAPLADCPTLTIVKVDDTNATQADIDALQKALPNCSISWDGTTDAAGAVRRTAEWILSNESNGWTLGILFDSKPIIVSEVAQLPVEPFTVNTVHMKTALDDDLARLRSCESITSLFLSGAPITDEGVLHLKKMKLMRILDLSRTAVSDASMPLVAGLANLDTLYLSEISIGDQGLLALQPLVKLKSLNVKKTRVTAEGVAVLQKAVPDCKIEWDGAPSAPGAK